METSSEQKLDTHSVLTHLRDAAPGPLSLEALATALELDDAEHPRLKEILDELTAAGSLVETRNASYGCPERMNLLVGRLRAHADGFGFVVPTGGTGQADLFVSGNHMKGAMNGDLVVGRVEHRRRSGRIEGRIIRILDRARTQLVGTYKERGKFSFVRPIDPKLGSEIMIDEANGATDGQLVTVAITDYASGKRPPAGQVEEVLGNPDDERIDVQVVIREYGLRHEFPEDVLAEAEKIPEEVSDAEIEGRTDFRGLPILTIDGESAKDFDDAVHVELRPNGLYRLHVHIADVGNYVKPGSALEREAIERATSVYFVDRTLPMLPESLSNGICSLRPGVDRLVQSVLIDIDRDGRTVNYEFHDGVIHSAARMTYRQVAAILDGDDAARAEHEDRLRDIERMGELAGILTEHRRERGSIDFDLPSPELILNLRGETEDVVRSERNGAHRLIEEFMIRANEVVASHLVWEDVPAVYRVHAGPDPERVESLRDFLSGLGHTLGGGRRPQPRDFMELLGRLEGRPEERVVSMMMLRSMKRAQYQVGNDGHFGLASKRYTHFTSPIRRFPDLIVHRALRAERQANERENGEVTDPAVPAEQLEALAASCSITERRAEEAERTYSAWKKLQFMADKVGETYEGHIVTVKSFGCFIELEPFFIEGLIPVSSLADDYYRFDESKHELRGERSGKVFKLGDRVVIRVAKVDMDQRHLDFDLVDGPLELEPPPPVKRRRRSRRRGRGSRRPEGGRGRRGKKETQEAGKDAKSEDAQPKTDEKPVEAQRQGGSEEAPRRRRRRGRRGGRRRNRSEQTSGDGERKSEGERKADKPRDNDKSREAKSDAKKSGSNSRGRGGRNDSRRSGRGRDNRGRGRGGKPRNNQRNEGAMPAAAPVVSEAKPTGDKKAKDKPAVNPYLTDIDF
ncbi:MAG: ribonuclease R [Acidobacteria bacterium]|nr:ribonuclease R [Acidobacteriota bacterium]